MAASGSPTCVDNILNASKGLWHLAYAGCSSFAVVAVAVVTAALALLLLGFDVLFIQSVGSQAPIHLMWALPVTLSFIAIDAQIIKKIGIWARDKIHNLSSRTHSAGIKMRHYFHAIRF